jgi:hypothetical protein
MGLFYIAVVLFMPHGMLRFAASLVRSWRGRAALWKQIARSGPAGLGR